MTAKEMFERLEYKLDENNEYLTYMKAKCIPDRLNTECIYFKTIKFINGDIVLRRYKTDALISETEGLNFILNLRELKAINKQVEELGWNNE